MRHLLGIEGMTRRELELLLNNAHKCIEVSQRDIKKVPSLRGKTVINLFLEASTRTRTSFEIAGKRLSADTINITASSSSTTKGESLLDTARTLQAMAPDVVVLRHRSSGAPHLLAQHLTKTSVINAGDGMHEHPTQALLDLLTLQEHFGRLPTGLTIAYVGDVRHSRVVRSNVWAHRLFGNHVRFIGPPTLVPTHVGQCFGKPVPIYHNLRQGLAGVDVVGCLRMQLERMDGNFVPSLEEYTNEYQVTGKVLDEVAPQAIVMHPGPINRGIEVQTALIDSERSLVVNQVAYGVAVRMAALLYLALGPKEVEYS